MRHLVLLVLWLAFAPALAVAAQPAVPPQAIDIPRWFTESFLDFREDIRDAAKDRKRLLVYFGQDGCPYCKALMKVNFGEKDIVAKTREHFVAIALNLWGDREVTWIDGRKMPEKQLARLLKVQYTPTLLFLDEKGGVALRLNGYVPPDKFRVALDYVAGRMEGRQSYAEYLAQRAGGKGQGGLTSQAFFEKGSLDLTRLRKPGKPLVVLFEQQGCAECVELHREGFARPEVKRLVAKFAVVQLDLAGDRTLVAPDGSPGNEREWAKALRVTYAPSLVFFDARGEEVFRAEGYLRPFHLTSALDYVASGAYVAEPSFQRFIQRRAESIRASGKTIDIWK